MSVFIYIQAKADLKGEDAGAVSFQHLIVFAKNEGEAYLEGQRQTSRSTFVRFKKLSEVINDYVIETNIDELEGYVRDRKGA